MYSLRNKINQLFISGYSGSDILKCKICSELLKQGLGGVIFFTQNIITKEQIKNNIQKIKQLSLIPPFLSIDQEGGRVERTENIHKGKKYLSAKEAAQKGLEFVQAQTEEICAELKEYGINMNFAPVLDTDTNPNNPIIGIRAYGNNPYDVFKFGQEVFKIHQKEGILPVGKHFPGHGDTSKDSHIEMPIVNIERKDFEKNHLLPFKLAIDVGLDVIMVSHVYYTCYDTTPVPASLSKNILTNLLKNELKFDGLVISDDMVMGAVGNKSKNIFIQGLLSGINMFIYRNSDEKLIQIIDYIEEQAEKNEELNIAISQSFEKVIELKSKYKLM